LLHTEIDKGTAERARSRVVVLDPIDSFAILRLAERFDVCVRPGLGEGEIIEACADADAIVVRSGVRISADVIRHAAKLKVIARAGSGFDNIDLDEARRRNIQVFNVPGESAQAVAELAFGLMLVLMRRISEADGQVRRGQWRKHELLGTELAEKTLGLVGVGKIGTRIARIACGFEMRVLGCTRTDRRDELAAAGIESLPFERLLTDSDIVCLAVPLTNETAHLIDKRALSLMKRTAFLINVSRSDVVCDAALLEALRDGAIGGIATDVPATESISHTSIRPHNLVATPHIGAMTVEAQRRVGVRLVELLERALAGVRVETAL
jgi:D-3-phosphoglycerate dehydrogenase